MKLALEAEHLKSMLNAAYAYGITLRITCGYLWNNTDVTGPARGLPEMDLR